MLFFFNNITIITISNTVIVLITFTTTSKIIIIIIITIILFLFSTLSLYLLVPISVLLPEVSSCLSQAAGGSDRTPWDLHSQPGSGEPLLFPTIWRKKGTIKSGIFFILFDTLFQ